MRVHSAEIVISAASKIQYPTDPMPEIALAGRSNVGKSSFINTMIQRKNLARTSGNPGKTQTLNFYIINNAFHFVDVPGYGYAKVSKAERSRWGKMMDEYFGEREQLISAVLVVDLRHEPSDEDCMMYDYFKYHDLPVTIIATKMDKVKKAKRPAQEKLVREVLEVEEEDPLIMFSSETGEGKDEAWKALRSHLKM